MSTVTFIALGPESKSEGLRGIGSSMTPDVQAACLLFNLSNGGIPAVLID
jgi:hypothetical protein